MTALIHVALGGALGASLRYLGVAAIYRLTGPAFPYGTMAVNLVGCLAMGALLGWLGPRTSAAPFLLTGVLGGFTTFSAFSADALRLVERGAMGAALIYVAVTLAGALAACALGYVTLKAITA